MVHAALLLLMLEAVATDLVSTISLKRSTQNLQLSTSWAGRLPHLWVIHVIAGAAKTGHVRYAPNSDRFLRLGGTTLSANIRHHVPALASS